MRYRTSAGYWDLVLYKGGLYIPNYRINDKIAILKVQVHRDGSSSYLFLLLVLFLGYSESVAWLEPGQI